MFTRRRGGRRRLGLALAGRPPPDLFKDCTEAIGEVGGFCLTLGRQRLYLVQTAQKGIAWLRLTAKGTAGHGSMTNTDNAVTQLAEAVARIGRHEWEPHLSAPVRALLEECASTLELELDLDDPAACPRSWSNSARSAPSSGRR